MLKKRDKKRFGIYNGKKKQQTLPRVDNVNQRYIVDNGCQYLLALQWRDYDVIVNTIDPLSKVQWIWNRRKTC